MDHSRERYRVSVVDLMRCGCDRDAKHRPHSSSQTQPRASGTFHHFISSLSGAGMKRQCELECEGSEWTIWWGTRSVHYFHNINITRGNVPHDHGGTTPICALHELQKLVSPFSELIRFKFRASFKSVLHHVCVKFERCLNAYTIPKFLLLSL